MKKNIMKSLLYFSIITFIGIGFFVTYSMVSTEHTLANNEEQNTASLALQRSINVPSNTPRTGTQMGIIPEDSSGSWPTEEELRACAQGQRIFLVISKTLINRDTNFKIMCHTTDPLTQDSNIYLLRFTVFMLQNNMLRTCTYVEPQGSMLSSCFDVPRALFELFRVFDANKDAAFSTTELENLLHYFSVSEEGIIFVKSVLSKNLIGGMSVLETSKVLSVFGFTHSAQ